MYKEENMNPAEKALESALGQLKPMANTLNRDKFMFNAGRASVGRKSPWQILSGTLTILLLCSVLIRPEMNRDNNSPISSQPNHIQVARIEYKNVEADSYNAMAYPLLRNKVMKDGLDALQSQASAGNSEPIMSQNELIEDMLSL